jgi:hypothetical protein
MADSPQEIRHPDGRIEHPRVRYETSDVRFHWVLLVLIAAVLIGAAVLFAVRLFLEDRQQRAEAMLRPRYPLADQQSRTLPAAPRLEQLDRLAGIESNSVQTSAGLNERLLGSYGPTPDEGYIRIPIERAIELVVPRLPLRKPSEEFDATKENGLVDSGEPNSGRLLRGANP